MNQVTQSPNLQGVKFDFKQIHPWINQLQSAMLQESTWNQQNNALLVHTLAHLLHCSHSGLPTTKVVNYSPIKWPSD